MIDSHIHPSETFLTELYEISLYGLSLIEEYKEVIRIFIDKNPNVKVAYGRGWSLGIFEGKSLEKDRKKDYLKKIN